MRGNFFSKIAFPSNISTYLSRTLIIITFATTFLIGGVLIFQQTVYFKRLNKQKSNEYIENQKNYIKEIVRNEIEYIRFQNDFFKRQINNKIQQNVNQALNTAEAIYQKYAGKKSDEEIKALIITTISSLRFDMEYQEVFISTMDGYGVYYPRKPAFSGKDMRQFKDSNGLLVILEEIKLLNKYDQGFLDYKVKSSTSTNTSLNKKITFVKRFGHFDWYFGSKQYTNDYFPKFKDEVAQKISTIRFRHGGYVFMNNMNGSPIVMDGMVYKGNLNLLNDTSCLLHNVFMQQLDVAKNNSDGGYFYYKWNKLNDTIPTAKCSFVQQFKDYNWLIGAGFYMDEIEQNIKDQQKALRADQEKNITIVIIIFGLLLLLEVLIIYHFNKRYKSDFDRFFNFFFSLQNNFNQLNISKFYFDEFKQAGVAANKMIELREEIENKLIEEQKKATESDRLKSAFLANMSHEIRTPMNAIIGFSELLEDENQDEKDKLLFIKLIQKNGEMLLNLINDIIDISKIEANLLSVRKKPVHLNKFLDEISDHYTEILASKKDKNIRLFVDNKTNPDILIQTDEIRLRQILDNLIGNAIKFTNTGTITVNVNIESQKVFFNIADTGIGISANHQDTIFDRFIQAEQGHNMNFGGTGLGLAISKNLIELLGGNIGVKSEPGKGSTFYFDIQSS